MLREVFLSLFTMPDGRFHLGRGLVILMVAFAWATFFAFLVLLPFR